MMTAYVTLSRENHETTGGEALVDSGAGATLVARSLAETLETKWEAREGCLVGLTGAKSKFIGVIKDQPISIHGISFKPVNLLVIEDKDLPYKLILGADFFRVNELTIDMGKNRLIQNRNEGILEIYCGQSGQKCRKIWRSLPCTVRNDTYVYTGKTELVPVEINDSILECTVCGPSPNPGSTGTQPSEYLFEGEKKDGKFKNRITGHTGLLTSKDSWVMVTKSTDSRSKGEWLRKGDRIGICHTLVDLEENHADLGMARDLPVDSLLPDCDIGEQLTSEQKAVVLKLISSHMPVMSLSESDIGTAGLVEHEIHLYDETPIRQRPRRFSPPMTQEIERQCLELLSHNIISHSSSPWSSPIVPVKKKDGSVRMCIDYRRLNSVTKPDRFPIPNLVESVFNLFGNKFFTLLDIRRAYYQIAIDEDSKEYTAFSTPNNHYEFNRLSFGLRNAPSCFQREIQNVLHGFPTGKVSAYIDDILIVGETFEEHLELVSRVLTTLGNYGLKINPAKCCWFKNQVKFLGHIISGEGVTKDPAYIETLKSYPKPTNVTEMRAFLGMINFQRKFIKNCSTISAPLYASTSGKLKKKDQIVWTTNMNNAFDALIREAQNNVRLAYPSYKEDAAPLELYVDASGYGAGAVLMQLQEGEKRVIGYASSTFNKSERNYSARDRELAALRWAVQNFRSFLYGVEFVVYSDHASLIYLHTMAIQGGNARLTRTLRELQEFTFEVRHIKGVDNITADGLSRLSSLLPLPDSYEEEKETWPSDFSVHNIAGGGDSLFHSFMAGLRYFNHKAENINSHKHLRESLTNELLAHPAKYGIKMNKETKRTLLATRNVGQFPTFEHILAFSYIFQMRVTVHHGLSRPVVFWIPKTPSAVPTETEIHLQCLGGVHFNWLRPCTAKVEVNMATIYLEENNFCSTDNYTDNIDVLDCLEESGPSCMENDLQQKCHGCHQNKNLLVEINGHSYCALMDSGANVSLIKPVVKTNESFSETTFDTNYVSSFGNAHERILSKCKPVKIDVKNHGSVGEVSFYTAKLEQFPYCIVIGADLLKSNNILVSCDSDVVDKLTCNYAVTNEDLKADSLSGNLIVPRGPVVIIEDEFIFQLQRKTRSLSQLFRLIRDKVPVADWRTNNLKSFKRYASHLVVQDLCVYYRQRDNYIIPVVSHALLIDIATTYHARNGHIGRDKTLSGVSNLIWHPNVRSVVRDICRACTHCQIYKISHQLVTPPCLKIQALDPFELVVCDLMELPKTSRGNIAILAVIDHFSKWINIIPLRSKKAKAVCEALIERVFPQFLRLPCRLLTDNGPEFKAGMFRELMDEYNITHIFTTPRNPTSAGVVERLNRTVLQLLRGFGSTNRNWDQNLPKVILSYNTTMHSAIGKSPSQCLLTASYSETMKPLIQLQDQQRWSEGHPKYAPFRVGDMVVKKIHFEGKQNVDKLKPKFAGPFKVIKVIDNHLTYRLVDVNFPDSPFRAHHRALKPWVAPPQYLLKCETFTQECASKGNHFLVSNSVDNQDEAPSAPVVDDGKEEFIKTEPIRHARTRPPIIWVPDIQSNPKDGKNLKSVSFCDAVAILSYDPSESFITLGQACDPCPLADLSCSEPVPEPGSHDSALSTSWKRPMPDIQLSKSQHVTEACASTPVGKLPVALEILPISPLPINIDPPMSDSGDSLAWDFDNVNFLFTEISPHMTVDSIHHGIDLDLTTMAQEQHQHFRTLLDRLSQNFIWNPDQNSTRLSEDADVTDLLLQSIRTLEQVEETLLNSQLLLTSGSGSSVSSTHSLSIDEDVAETAEPAAGLRRSTRVKKVPARFNIYQL